MTLGPEHWLSCYIHHSRASFSLGRPFTLDASEITVSKPSVSTDATSPRWKEYQPNAIQQMNPPYSTSEAPHDLIGLISEHRITLYDLVEPIARALSVCSR